MKRVTKAVFPAAGMGTRFLPATKANPKEMLPIVDKPLIQYAAEEAAAAGITDLIFIIGRSKRSIADHFDKAYELESELEARGKGELLEFVREMIPKDINCIYIRQAEALGLDRPTGALVASSGNFALAIASLASLLVLALPVIAIDRTGRAPVRPAAQP